MAVQFKKKQVVQKKAADILQDEELREKVDRYVEGKAELKARQDELVPLVKEMGTLDKFFLNACDVLPADKKVTFEGVEHTLEVGMRGNQSKVVVGVDEVFELVGEDVFKLIATFGITAVKKYCSAAQQEEILLIKRTGKRPIKVIK